MAVVAVVGVPRVPVIVTPNEAEINLGIRLPSQRMYASQGKDLQGEICGFLADMDETEAGIVGAEVAQAGQRFIAKATGRQRVITLLILTASMAGCAAAPIKLVMINLDRVNLKPSIKWIATLVASIAGIIFGALRHPNFEYITTARKNRLGEKVRGLQQELQKPALDLRDREQIARAAAYFEQTLRELQGPT